MTRRGGQLPWGSRGARPVLLGAIVLGVVVLAVFLLMRACGGDSCGQPYCASGRDIPPPDGYERLTQVFEYNKDQPLAQGTYQVQLPLTKTTTDTQGLSFYRYVEDTRAWEQITP